MLVGAALPDTRIDAESRMNSSTKLKIAPVVCIEVSYRVSDVLRNTQRLEHVVEELVAQAGEGRFEIQKNNASPRMIESSLLPGMTDINNVFQHAAVLEESLLHVGDPLVEGGLQKLPEGICYYAVVCVDDDQWACICRGVEFTQERIHPGNFLG